ncbi:MAG: AMP-binding protein [Rhodobacteraceae bacterium]|nr:AMP-binding protein [Paracoccaceae bacterium]
MSQNDVVWTPSSETLENANLTAFLKHCGMADYNALIDWSNADLEGFNTALLEFIGYRFYKPYDQVMDTSAGPQHVKWCVGGKTNVVLNCLDRWLEGEARDKVAIEWEGETGGRLTWTYGDLHRETSKLAGGLRKLGLGRGDVVAMYLPNVPQAIVALLAVAKIGGVVLPMFSGFGADAVATRLNDGGAKAVITVDGSPRRAKVVDAKVVVDQAVSQSPTVEHVIVSRHMGNDVAWTDGRDHWWDDLVDGLPEDAPTEEMDADAPFMLIYTSGTTGKPKGVVHSHCGFPVKTALDLGICMDFKPEDRFLWMSDMGWLVGPILVYGGLLMGGTVVLVEGAPNYPEKDRFWRLIQDYKVSYLGIAPTIVRSLMPNGPEQLDPFDLSSLRVFVSTGESWNPDAWHWLFDHVGKGNVPLLNYSGGTEVGGILTTTVTHPLVPCAFTGPIPGVGADAVDDVGNSLGNGEIGELVMKRPSIGLTRGLWNDNKRYLDSYWDVIPGMWVHGDFASRNVDGSWFIHGRSDDTLKIAGKRTGPSEIETLLLDSGKVFEAAVIGAPDEIKGSAVICVCVPAAGVEETDKLRAELSQVVVAGLGAPFRPKDIIFVPDLPKTRNMKIMRRVVKAVYLNQNPGDLSSLVNPEAVAELGLRFSGRARE